MKRGRHLRRGLWVALAGAVLLSAGGRADDTPAAEPAAEPAPIKEIKMFAENWKWTPNVIRVPQGTRLRIRIENIEAPHRFTMKGYKVKVQLPEGETTMVEILADKLGTFRWYCSRPCGNGCPKMTGKLIVDEASSE